MLLSLSISNIALIEKTEIDFTTGFNVLSGETGAGKSIIVDSIYFVLGGRADKSLIRYGEEKAAVQAVFTVNSDSVKELLSEYDVDYDDELIIYRSITADGKNVCRANGVKITLQMLRSLTIRLVNIYGQNDSSELLREQTHMPLIDAYGAKELRGPLDDMRRLYSQYKDTLIDIKKYGSISDIERNIDILKYQIDEITGADIKPGEEAALTQTLNKYDNVENIIKGLSAVLALSREGDYSGAPMDAISSAASELIALSSYDEKISGAADRLDSVYIELKDIMGEVGEILDNIEYDETGVKLAEERLETVNNVLRKYGGSEKSVSDNLAELQEKLDFYLNGDKLLNESTAKKGRLIADMTKTANIITSLRKRTAKSFENEIERELHELGMKGAKFKVNFEEREGNKESYFSAVGQDKIQFMISPNLGQPLKPLSKIISGGETSRFMLAIKKITAALEGIDTLIFDEVDSGISGEIAQIVACKLYDISVNRQVMAITHLPQLAAMADAHFLITKSVTDGNTHTELNLLDKAGERDELARLIGGKNIGEYAPLHAKEMKAWANEYKSRV